MPGRLLKVVRRLHASTWVVAACTALVLLLANLTAKIIVEPNLFGAGKYGPHFECGTHYEHGWPVSFVRREAARWQPLVGYRPVSRWKIHENVARLSLGWLIADLIVSTGLLVFATLGFEAWRWRRRSVFQWHLKDVFAAITATGLFFGWLAAERSEHQSELGCLKQIDEIQREVNGSIQKSSEEWAEWQRGCFWLLRDLFEDQWFRQFDRVVGIRFLGSGQLRCTTQLKHLKTIGLWGPFEVEELAALKELPELVAVDVAQCYTPNEDGIDDEAEDHSADPLLEILSTLPQLRGINLYEGGVSTWGLKQLKTLRKLQVLDLTGADASDEGLECLQGMSDLRILSLANNEKLTDRGMRHFGRLSRLEELSLGSTEITDAGLAMLPPMPHLRSLDLSQTRLTEKSVPILSRMSSLFDLNIMQTSIPAAAVDELQRALPNCRIIR